MAELRPKRGQWEKFFDARERDGRQLTGWRKGATVVHSELCEIETKDGQMVPAYYVSVSVRGKPANEKRFKRALGDFDVPAPRWEHCLQGARCALVAVDPEHRSIDLTNADIAEASLPGDEEKKAEPKDDLLSEGQKAVNALVHIADAATDLLASVTVLQAGLYMVPEKQLIALQDAAKERRGI